MEITEELRLTALKEKVKVYFQEGYNEAVQVALSKNNDLHLGRSEDHKSHYICQVLPTTALMRKGMWMDKSELCREAILTH